MTACSRGRTAGNYHYIPVGIANSFLEQRQSDGMRNLSNNLQGTTIFQQEFFSRLVFIFLLTELLYTQLSQRKRIISVLLWGMSIVFYLLW